MYDLDGDLLADILRALITVNREIKGNESAVFDRILSLQETSRFDIAVTLMSLEHQDMLGDYVVVLWEVLYRIAIT